MSDGAHGRSGRQVTFVPRVEDAPPGAIEDLEDLVVVLDTAWTPGPDNPPNVVSLRPYFAAAVERHNLFRESLELLDRWAEAAGIADLIEVEGVTYWYRLREDLWHWVHERLLWRYALAGIDPDARVAVAAIPETEPALIDVAKALGWAVHVDAFPSAAGLSAPAPPTSLRRPATYLPSPLRRLGRRLLERLGAPPPERGPRAERTRRRAFVEARFQALKTARQSPVLVLTLPSSYQRIGSDASAARLDPNLGSVIPALEEAALEPIVIGWDMNIDRDEDWAIVARDERMLPSDFVYRQWARPEDAIRVRAAIEAVMARLDEAFARATSASMVVDGVDLAPALGLAVRAVIERTFNGDVRELARVERLIVDLRPRAVLMTQEGRRLPWLIAASRASVPTLALQHGVLYPDHPGYPNRRHPSHVLATRTFVFGDYERDALVQGAYHADEVVVSGSPRLDLEAVSEGPRPVADERGSVRAELGVAEGNLTLVVSTLNLGFIRRSHFVHMLEIVLGGPLPRIHLIFKRHPGERDEGPYRELFAGLARARGYELPPMTFVKDIDLYRLLGAADAHLGQSSTVLSDAVVTNTPNLVAIVEAGRDPLGYVDAGVARPVRNVTELLEAMATLRPPDPDARRAFLDAHFRSGNAAARIVSTIESVVAEQAPASPAGVA